MRFSKTMFHYVSRYLERKTKKGSHFMKVTMAVILFCGMVGICHFIFGSDGQNTVYAVKEGEPSDDKLQAGVAGFVNGINSMEAYSKAAREKNLENAYEKILVGTASVDKRTLNKLAAQEVVENVSDIGSLAEQVVEQNQMAYEDYYALLQIVEAEATGQDIKSKILVANVVLNRVADPHFPDTPYEVIWENVNGAPQFSPTYDGRIYTCEITEETIEAVGRALSGEDYSQGALYFIARSSAETHNVIWFDESLKRLFEYDGTEFYTLAG